jgi:hypothetical protein
MVTVDTLGKASRNGPKFISCILAQFKLAGELTRTAWTGEKPWIPMGKPSPSGKAAFYETKWYSGEINGIPYRFLVVHSSALDGRKRKAPNRMMGGVLLLGLWTSGKGAFMDSWGMRPCAWRRKDGRSAEDLRKMPLGLLLQSLLFRKGQDAQAGSPSDVGYT